MKKNQASPLHVLLITSSYGAYADSHTIRLRNILSGIDPNKYLITLVSPGPALPSTSIDLPNLNNVIITKTPISFLVIKFLKDLPFFGKSLSWFFSNLFYRLALPDSFFLWDKTVISEIRRLPNKPDIIFSASGSVTAHLAAAKASNLMGIPWIADYGDPWYLVDKKQRPYLSVYSKFKEKQILKIAKKIIFTTSSTANQYKDWLGINCPNIEVIEYGYAKIDINNVNAVSTNPDIILFSHVGTAHTSDRNLLPLINAISNNQKNNQSKNIGFILGGRRSEAFDQEIIRIKMENVEAFGSVSYSQSLQLMARSGVLVVVGNKSGLQIPGKVFICLALARPILYIDQSSASGDEARQLLSNVDGVVFAKNDVTSISTAISYILQNYDRLLAESKARTFNHRVINFESNSLGKKLTNLFKEALI